MNPTRHNYLFEPADGKAYRLNFLRSKVVGREVRDLVNKEQSEYTYGTPRKLTKSEYKKVLKEFDRLTYV